MTTHRTESYPQTQRADAFVKIRHCSPILASPRSARANRGSITSTSTENLRDYNVEGSITSTSLENLREKRESDCLFPSLREHLASRRVSILQFFSTSTSSG